MKIVALIKTWSGEEWLKASVLSILKHVDKVVLLTSDVSWIGHRGNPSIPMIEEIMKLHNQNNKIIHINYDEPNQLKHCQYGYEWIKKNFPDTDYIFLGDSDEIWDDQNMITFKNYVLHNPQYDAYRVNIYTYIKSPLFRIDPVEPLKPVSMISTRIPNMGTEARACTIKPFVCIPDVYYHHYVFVRMHFNHVLEKLVQSHTSEKQPYEDMSQWIPNVWNTIPNVPKSWTEKRGGFHPAIGFGRNWKSIKVINKNEVPRILHNSNMPIAKKFGL